VSIQVLQYEFLGPIKLSEWGPPMGELVYMIMGRDKDRFNMLYVGDCDNTDDKAFFVQHEQFKCWVERAGSDTSLYLAVFPMKDSDAKRRQTVLSRIVANYHPPCNPVNAETIRPSYNVRRTTPDDTEKKDGLDAASSTEEVEGIATPGISCPCCGSSMHKEKAVSVTSSLYRCSSCGMSDTRID